MDSGSEWDRLARQHKSYNLRFDPLPPWPSDGLVGTATAMAAAGLCAVLGGTPAPPATRTNGGTQDGSGRNTTCFPRGLPPGTAYLLPKSSFLYHFHLPRSPGNIQFNSTNGYLLSPLRGGENSAPCPVFGLGRTKHMHEITTHKQPVVLRWTT